MPYPYTIGGGTTYLTEFAKALIKKGHEVYIISSKPEKESKIEINNAIKIYNVGLRHKKISKNLLFAPYDIIRRISYEISFMIQSYKTVTEISPDLIQCETGLTESLSFALMNKKFIIREHGRHILGITEFYKKSNNPIHKIGLWVYKKIENFDVKKARKIICISNETKQYYEKFAGKKCILLGNGIDISNFKPLKKKNQYFFLGRISKEKGLDLLLEALDILDNKKNKRIKVIIAGDGDKDYLSSLKIKASKLKNIDVSFVGKKIGKEKTKLFGESSHFISPSTSETFGITILEAMASGCAVISSNTEGPKEIVKSSFGKIVNYSNKEERAGNLAKAIEYSIDWDIGKMGKEARKEVKKYEISSLVDKYLKIYKEVLK